MPSFYASAALVATSASLALAVPTTFKKGFSVPRVPTGHKNTLAASYLKAYHKYGAQAPAELYEAANSDGTGSVAANPTQYDEEYLCSVTVGNNNLNLDFDTGSSDLWVFSTVTPSSESSGHNLYDTSSGQQQQGETWKITYGDGSGASGIVFADTVVVGGATVTGQSVEAATSVSSSFASGAGDGLLGLGYESGNTCTPNQCQTFFGNLMNSVPSPLFTADLQENGGSYDFGYIDNSQYSGSITYVNVLQQNPSYWDFTAGDFSVNGNDGGNVGYAIMDTGTTLWLLPDNQVSTFYGQISGSQNSPSAGGYVFPCNANVPAVDVNIGGTTFTVPGSALVMQALNDGSGNCYGGIQSAGNFPGAIFGDVFMKNFFVVFDLGNNQLGVASQ